MALNDVGIVLEIGGFLVAGCFAVILFDKELSGNLINELRSKFDSAARKLGKLQNKISVPKGWPSATILSSLLVIAIASAFTPLLHNISPLFRLIGLIVMSLLLIVIISEFFFDKQVKQALIQTTTNKGWYPLLLLPFLITWCLYPLGIIVIALLKAVLKILSLAGKTLSLTHSIKLLCLSTGSAAIIAGLVIELITN